jgi:hypothetical protein
MPALAHVILLALLMGGTPAARHWHDGDDRGKNWQLHDHEDDRNGGGRAHGCLFEPNDLRVLTHYYAPRGRSLSPEIEKALYRTGHLPRGWEHKIKPPSLGAELRLTPLPHNYRRGYVDRYAIVYDPATQTILDVAVVF